MNAQKEQKKRNISFGAYSAFITLTAISIVGLVNFLGQQYPQKVDLTKNKIHTFSDQTLKVMKSLREPVNAVFYGDMGSREKYRPVFENYKKASTQFKLEWFDPNREPTRAKAAGIKKMDTLVLTYKGKVSKLEEVTEEKITNELIKLTKETRSVVCFAIGHGEASISDQTGAGFSAAKKGLEEQSYEARELNLPQIPKVPADCSAVILMGASKALFPAEVKGLTEYLASGGRLVTGVDAVLTGADPTQEWKSILQQYGVSVKPAMIIDPVSKMLGVDASVPIMAQFNKETALGRDFSSQCYFPFARPLELVNPAPEGFKTDWMAKSTPKSFGETDLAALGKGTARFDQGKDLAGPLASAVIVSGKAKGSSATRETRLVVFGSGQFPNNQFSRFGGNLDLFLNAVSWAVEDESMISIRTKEADAAAMELTQNQGLLIFWLCIVILPLGIAILGIVIWVRRKKL